MDVVYRPPAHYPPGHSGSTVRRTQSTHDEATRILKWNYDVATDSWSAARPPADRHQVGRRPSQQPTDEPYAVFRRSVTTSTIEPSPRRSSTSNGLSNGAVVGTLLGVAAGAAAGAAITYGMIRKDRARAPRQEFDMPTFPRRSTFRSACPPTTRRTALWSWSGRPRRFAIPMITRQHTTTTPPSAVDLAGQVATSRKAKNLTNISMIGAGAFQGKIPTKATPDPGVKLPPSAFRS